VLWGAVGELDRLSVLRCRLGAVRRLWWRGGRGLNGGLACAHVGARGALRGLRRGRALEGCPVCLAMAAWPCVGAAVWRGSAQRRGSAGLYLSGGREGYGPSHGCFMLCAVAVRCCGAGWAPVGGCGGAVAAGLAGVSRAFMLGRVVLCACFGVGVPRQGLLGVF
jgi:hypothetical protein